MNFINIQGRRLEYIRLPPSQPRSPSRKNIPSIVFLHEGLGSLSMWRDFPQQIANATGCEAVVYSRYGYGHSDPIDAPRTPRYMHDEALLALPEFLDRLDIEAPLLLGHSDGASIALIHAGGQQRPVSGLILMAPHLMVETMTVSSIAAARKTYETTDLPQRLGRHHTDVDKVFWGWNDIWLHPDFLAWNIEEYVPPIRVPILAIQGMEDEYGSMEQIDRIARLSHHPVDLLKLAHCRHSPHKDQPDVVISAVSAFIDRLVE